MCHDFVKTYQIKNIFLADNLYSRAEKKNPDQARREQSINFENFWDKTKLILNYVEIVYG